jgi:hypothetical protein
MRQQTRPMQANAGLASGLLVDSFKANCYGIRERHFGRPASHGAVQWRPERSIDSFVAR